MAALLAFMSLLLAVLRCSDGSLLLASAVGRVSSSSSETAPQHHLREHQYRQAHRRVHLEDEEDEEDAEMAAAERWLLYETAPNGGVVDLDGIPPPPPGPFHPPPPVQRLPPPWSKRDDQHLAHGQSSSDSHGGVPEVPKGIASQMMLRSTRGNRQYDVPQIECPPAEDGMERFACPTPDRMGRYRCIDDHVLCDGFIDCPSGEDEDRQACMFYKTLFFIKNINDTAEERPLLGLEIENKLQTFHGPLTDEGSLGRVSRRVAPMGQRSLVVILYPLYFVYCRTSLDDRALPRLEEIHES